MMAGFAERVSGLMTANGRSVNGENVAIYHDRDSLLRDIKNLPEGLLNDGVLIDCPKRRRREQAMNKRPMLIKLPPDQKLRLGKQLNRYIELCGKDLGIELLLKFTELPTDEELKSYSQQ
jgi:hypothetical protein